MIYQDLINRILDQRQIDNMNKLSLDGRMYAVTKDEYKLVLQTVEQPRLLGYNLIIKEHE